MAYQGEQKRDTTNSLKVTQLDAQSEEEERSETAKLTR